MHKALLVYFSGTGVTRYYASLIQEQMEKRGFSCDCLNLEELVDLPTLWQKKPVALHYTINAEKKRPLGNYPWPYQDLKEALRTASENPLLSKLKKEWADYRLIGFGSPVYSFRPAPVMIRFLLDLPGFDENVRAFSFATHDGAQGDYEAFMKYVLGLKGFHYVGHLDQTFVYSASIVMRRHFDHVKTGHLLAQKTKQAEINIGLFLDYVESLGYDFSYRYPGPDTLSKMVALPYRLLYSYGVDILLNHLLFGYGINKEDCVQCMTCVNQCPQGLLEVDDDGYPIRYYHCMYCLRCLNWCPTSALYFSAVTRDKARFPGLEVMTEAALQHDLDFGPEKRSG